MSIEKLSYKRPHTSFHFSWLYEILYARKVTNMGQDISNKIFNGRTRAVKFPPPILVEYGPSWPKLFQTGRISPKSAQKTRILANLDDIWPKSLQKFNCAHLTVFKRISAKKISLCVKFKLSGSFGATWCTLYSELWQILTENGGKKVFFNCFHRRTKTLLLDILGSLNQTACSNFLNQRF
jgi:hypothetical protein